MRTKLPSPVKYYSPSMRGFYCRDVHKSMPLDVVEIPNARWRELLDANSKGMDIVADKDGFPQAAPHSETPEQMKASLPYRRAVALRRSGELIERHRDELELGKPTTLTTVQYTELVIYRAAVRDAAGDIPESPHFIRGGS